MNNNELNAQAKEMGAVAYGDLMSRQMGINRERMPVLRYYFNANGDEVAYFSYDLRDLGLTVHATPRQWAQTFKDDLGKLETLV